MGGCAALGEWDMGQELFRKAAMDRLASPERLDVLMQVTSPRGWIALWTLGGVLVCVLAWSVFGSIPTRIDGLGILLRGGSLREIRAEGQGVLTQLNLKTGDTVRPDQAVGVIAQLDIEAQVDQLRQKYGQAQREYEAASSEDQATIAGSGRHCCFGWNWRASRRTWCRSATC